jgi:hypothetical protein
MASVWVLLPAQLCRAGGLLNFQLNPEGPIIGLGSGTLNYNALTGEFSGTMVPLTYSSPNLPGNGTGTFSSNSLFTFTFYVNSDGSFRSDPDGFNLMGTLTLNGLNPPVHLSGSLLSGDFYDFGAEPPGPPEWVSNALVNPTGGLLTAPQQMVGVPVQFPLTGPPIGIDFFVNNVTSGTLGDFTQSFTSSDVSGVFGQVIPEPATWVPATIGLGAVLLCFGWHTSANGVSHRARA